LTPFALKGERVRVRAGNECLPDRLGCREGAAATVSVRYDDYLAHDAAVIN